MSFVLKDPDAVLDYLFDWGADYLGDGDLLAASEWSVDPDEQGGVAVTGSDFAPSTSTVKVGGGIAGRIYRVVNKVTTASGRVDERSIVIRVEDR
jgi:hypothetical protein